LLDIASAVFSGLSPAFLQSFTEREREREREKRELGMIVRDATLRVEK
jgi:hypothetical protein